MKVIEYIKNNIDADELTEIYKEPILIGVTGSIGKSSTVYLIAQYLKYLGKIVSYSSSMGMEIGNETKPLMTTISTKKSLSDFLKKSILMNSDYIILECNENIIVNNIYTDLDFSYKMLTNFSKSFNPHIPGDKYLSIKKSFFENSNSDCKFILNSDAECVDDFINVCNEKGFLYSLGTPNCVDFKPNTSYEVYLYPIHKVSGIDKSFCNFVLDGTTDEFITTLSLNTGIDMSLSLLALASKLEGFDIERFREFVLLNAIVPGRCEDIQVQGRTIMVDSGNSLFIEKVINEINSEEGKISREKYKEKYGVEFPSFKPKAIKAIFSHAMTNSVIREKLKNDSNFTFINNDLELVEKERATKKLYRKNFIFNFLALIFNLSSIDEIYKVFDMVENTDGNCELVKLENKNILDNEELKYLREISLNSVKKIPRLFTIMVLQSIMCEDKLFNKIIDVFEANNFDVNTIQFIKNTMENFKAAYLKCNERINNLKDYISKIYITPSNFNNIETEWELIKISKFLSVDNSIVTYRKDAIKKILDESKVGDLILIAGRGNIERYTNNNQIEFFTDMDVVNSMTTIQEVEVI